MSIEHLKLMDLGKHHWNFNQGHNRIKSKDSVALEVIKFVKDEVLGDEHPLKSILSKKKYEKVVSDDLDHYEQEKRDTTRVRESGESEMSSHDSMESDDSDEPVKGKSIKKDSSDEKELFAEDSEESDESLKPKKGKQAGKKK